MLEQWFFRNLLPFSTIDFDAWPLRLATHMCSILDLDTSTVPGGYTFGRLRDVLAGRIAAISSSGHSWPTPSIWTIRSGLLECAVPPHRSGVFLHSVQSRFVPSGLCGCVLPIPHYQPGMRRVPSRSHRTANRSTGLGLAARKKTASRGGTHGRDSIPMEMPSAPQAACRRQLAENVTAMFHNGG